MCREWNLCMCREMVQELAMLVESSSSSTLEYNWSSNDKFLLGTSNPLYHHKLRKGIKFIQMYNNTTDNIANVWQPKSIFHKLHS